MGFFANIVSLFAVLQLDVLKNQHYKNKKKSDTDESELSAIKYCL